MLSKSLGDWGHRRRQGLLQRSKPNRIEYPVLDDPILLINGKRYTESFNRRLRQTRD
jgi:hypothetical protein